MMDIFSPKHLLMILMIVLLVFGTKKLRTIGTDLGSAVKGFKDSMRSEKVDAHHTPTVALESGLHTTNNIRSRT